MELYQSRLRELRMTRAECSEIQAAGAFHLYLLGCTTDHIEELDYWDRERIHNQKYFTWIEQQGKTCDEITEQLYQSDYWSLIHEQVGAMDTVIESFNARLVC
jgi:cysteine synthase A